MKILLFGKDGQVGWELQRSLAPLGEIVACGRRNIDLADLDGIRRLIRQQQPDFIVNAAAYTAVDKAENEPEVANTINRDAPGAMAEEAAKHGAWLIHYSTDYVFDGEKKSPYTETDAANPLNVYGVTKLAGEEMIRSSKCSHLIFRSSWVFSEFGANFPLAILHRAKERDRLDVVDDCIGAPTCAAFMADVTALAIYRLFHDAETARTASGTYHLTAAGETSWYEYAKFLVGCAKSKGVSVLATEKTIFPINSTKYPMSARRPKNSRLDCSKLTSHFGVTLPRWEARVERLITKLIRKQLL